MSTSAVDVSIQAVSPRSIFEGAGAGAAAAGAGVGAGVCACAHTTVSVASTSSVASAKVSRFKCVLLGRGDSERALILLAGSDPDGGLHGQHEDLSVTDVAGLGRGGHHLGHLVDQMVGDHDLDLDLGQEIHRVLAAAVELRVALLTSEASHFGDRHADDLETSQCIHYVVQLERLDDRLDLFHSPPSRS